MHVWDGLIGDHIFPMLAGKRKAGLADCVHNMKNKVKQEDFKRRNAEIKEDLKMWRLSQAQKDEVDRRWATVKLPHKQKTNYCPFADAATFTSADWFHLMVYAGRWIMDGILSGRQLLVWMRLCRVGETLARQQVHPHMYEEMQTLVVDSVALCEADLPDTEHVIKLHNLINLVADIIDKGPIHGFWLFRFERQWGAITQLLRAHSDRSRVEGSLIRIVKTRYRYVEPIFQNELLEQAIRYSRHSRAIQSWQGTQDEGLLFDGKEKVVIPRGDWELMAELQKGEADDEESLVAMATDLKQDIMNGDLISLDVCSDVTIMHRDFTPYRGSYTSDLFPFQKRQLFQSYVSVIANRSVQRYEKCAGQVQAFYRVTITRGDEVIFTRAVAKMVLFQIHEETLADDPADDDSLVSIVKTPFYWARGRENRPRLIGLNEIYSACVLVPRVNVAASTHVDLRYHEYHLIELRRT